MKSRGARSVDRPAHRGSARGGGRLRADQGRIDLQHVPQFLGVSLGAASKTITSVNGRTSATRNSSAHDPRREVGSTLKIGIIRDRRALTVNVPVEKMVPMNR
jgi:hypothetical protein